MSSIFPCFNGCSEARLTVRADHPTLKKLGFALSILMILSGVLGMAYGIGSFSSSHLFAPMQGWEFYFKMILVTTTAAVAGFGFFFLCQLRNVKESAPISTTKNDVAEPLNRIKIGLEKNVQANIDKILNFLSQGYSHKLEYYEFYYHVYKVSQLVLKNQNLKGDWLRFLNAINDMHIKSVKKDGSVLLDCTVELERMEGNTLTLSEVKKISGQDEKVNKQIQGLMVEAFDIAYFPDGEGFIIQNDSSRDKEVLACIFCSEKNGNSLLIHSLARKASAIGLGLTEKFEAHIKQVFEKKKYEKILCEVDIENHTAIALYKKLHFVKSGKAYIDPLDHRAYMYMHYDPQGNDAETLTYGVRD